MNRIRSVRARRRGDRGLAACSGAAANPSGVASLGSQSPAACVVERARGIGRSRGCRPRLRPVHARARRRHARSAGRLERRDVVLDRRRARTGLDRSRAPGGTGGVPGPDADRSRQAGRHPPGAARRDAGLRAVHARARDRHARSAVRDRWPGDDRRPRRGRRGTEVRSAVRGVPGGRGRVRRPARRDASRQRHERGAGRRRRAAPSTEVQP